MIGGCGLLARALRGLTSTFQGRSTHFVYVGHDFMEKAMDNAAIACGAVGQAGARPDICPRTSLRTAITKAAKARSKKQAYRRSTPRAFLPRDTMIKHLDQVLDLLKVPRKQREQIKQQVLRNLRDVEHVQQIETTLQQVLQLVPDMQQDPMEGKLPDPAATVTAALVVMGGMLWKQQDQAAAFQQSQAELQQKVQQLLQQRDDLKAQVASKNEMIKQHQRQQAARQMELAIADTAIEQLKKQRKQLKQQVTRQALRGQAIEVDLRNMQVTIKSLRIRCDWLRCALFPALTLRFQQKEAEYRSALAAKDAAIADQAAATQRMAADHGVAVEEMRHMIEDHDGVVQRMAEDMRLQRSEHIAAVQQLVTEHRVEVQQMAAEHGTYREQVGVQLADLTAKAKRAIQRQRQATRCELALKESELIKHRAHFNATHGLQGQQPAYEEMMVQLGKQFVAEPWVVAKRDDVLPPQAEGPYRPAPQGSLSAATSHAGQQQQQQANVDSAQHNVQGRTQDGVEYEAECGQEAACWEGYTEDEQACGEGYGQHEVECGAGYRQDEEDSFQQGATEGHQDASQQFAATGQPAYSGYAAAYNSQYAMPTAYSMQYGQYVMYSPQAMDSAQCVNQQGSQAEQGGVPASYHSWPYLVPYYDQYGNPQGWGPYMPSCAYLPQYAAAGSGSDGAAGEPGPLQQVYEGGEGGDDGVKYVDNSGSAPVYCVAA